MPVQRQMYPPSRYPNGEVVEGHDWVAADLIALVSGVSGGAVAKVLIAIQAIGDVYGLDASELTDASKVPTRPADPARFSATSTASDVVATEGRDVMQMYENDLHFLDRHNHPNRSKMRTP